MKKLYLIQCKARAAFAVSSNLVLLCISEHDTLDPQNMYIAAHLKKGSIAEKSWFRLAIEGFGRIPDLFCDMAIKSNNGGLQVDVSDCIVKAVGEVEKEVYDRMLKSDTIKIFEL